MNNNVPQEIVQSVVRIDTAHGSGSGFYLKDKNVIVTNHHVVGAARTIAIEDQHKHRTLGHVIQLNPAADIALVVPEKPLEDIPQAVLQTYEVNVVAGEKVLVLGFPFGMPFTITEGIVSAPEQQVGQRKMIQTDAAVNPGNSGGPLVNLSGEIVGITSSKFQNADNVGFAIPINDLHDDLKQFESNTERKFSVRCISCGNLQFEAQEFCETCGVEQDPALFAPEQPASLIAAVAENGIQKLGIHPALARRGVEFWSFVQDDVEIKSWVYHKDARYLVTALQLAQLPDSNHAELYRYMIQHTEKPYTFVLHNNIDLRYVFNVLDLNNQDFAEEAANQIANLAQQAGRVRNHLVNEFDAKPIKIA